MVKVRTKPEVIEHMLCRHCGEPLFWCRLSGVGFLTTEEHPTCGNIEECPYAYDFQPAFFPSASHA